jgi:hypothetical protein
MCALKSRNELTLAGSQPYLSKTCLGQCLNLTCCVEHIMCTCNVIPHTRKSSLNTSEGRIRDTSRLLQLAALYATMQPRTFHNLHCIWGTSTVFLRLDFLLQCTERLLRSTVGTTILEISPVGGRSSLPLCDDSWDLTTLPILKHVRLLW